MLDVDTLDLLQRMRLAAATRTDAAVLDRFWLAPWRVMETPDPWQRDVLSQLVTRRENALMLCSRGAGKSKAVSAASYLEACLGGFALVISRSDRQAMKVFGYVLDYHKRHKLVESVRETMHELVLENGGRVMALPCREDTIRGEHGVTLLVIDEASRVPDQVYGAVTAMTAVSKGRIALLTTPWGRRGFFYKEWSEGTGWRRHRYSWHDCPRLTPEFVDAERRRHGEAWVRQEYLDCAPGEEFLSVESGPFDVVAFEGLVDPDLRVLEW